MLNGWTGLLTKIELGQKGVWGFFDFWYNYFRNTNTHDQPDKYASTTNIIVDLTGYMFQSEASTPLFIEQKTPKGKKDPVD